jgi:hypothetical protein
MKKTGIIIILCLLIALIFISFTWRNKVRFYKEGVLISSLDNSIDNFILDSLRYPKSLKELKNYIINSNRTDFLILINKSVKITFFIDSSNNELIIFDRGMFNISNKLKNTIVLRDLNFNNILSVFKNVIFIKKNITRVFYNQIKTPFYINNKSRKVIINPNVYRYKIDSIWKKYILGSKRQSSNEYYLKPGDPPKKILLYGKRQNNVLKIILLHHNLDSIQTDKPFLDNVIKLYENSLNSDTIKKVCIPVYLVEKHQLVEE